MTKHDVPDRNMAIAWVILSSVHSLRRMDLGIRGGRFSDIAPDACAPASVVLREYPAVGGVVEDEGRMGRHNLVWIDDLLASLRDSIQNRAPQDPLIVFQAIEGVLFHCRDCDLLKLAVKETIEATHQHQGEHHEERQDFGDRVSLLFFKPCVPDDAINLEGLRYIE